MSEQFPYLWTINDQAMRKLCLFLFVSVFAIACSKASPEREIRICASFSTESGDNSTRVSYTENEESGQISLDPAWEIGDTVIGYYGDKTFEYTISAMDEGDALLTWARGYKLNGTESGVNMFYAPGVDYTSAKTFNINYAKQDVNNTLPCLLSSSGSFDSGGALVMKFHPQVAVLSIRGIEGLAAGETIDKIVVAGTTTSEIAVTNSATGWMADEFGIVSQTVRVVLPVGGGIRTVSAKITTDGESNNKQIIQFQREIVAGKHYYTTLTHKAASVQTGSKKRTYPTIAAAISAANSYSGQDALVTMLEDASSSSALEINNGSNCKIILDLNGKTLSSQIEVKTDFDIKDTQGSGAIRSVAPTVNLGTVAAKLSISGGSIVATSGNYAIAAYGSSSDTGLRPDITITKCRMEATGGSAISSRYAKFTFNCSDNNDIVVTGGNGKAIFASSSSQMYIYGGVFSGTTNAIHFGASTTKYWIYGGIFKAGGNFSSYASSKLQNAPVEISGGYFSWGGSTFAMSGHTQFAISGGYFTSAVSGFVASGHSQSTEGGPWTNGTGDGIDYNYMVK